MKYTIRFWWDLNEEASLFLLFPVEEGRVHMHVHGDTHRAQVLFFFSGNIAFGVASSCLHIISILKFPTLHWDSSY